MKDIQLDESGDMIYTPIDGTLSTISDKDEIKQKIQLALATNASELEWNVEVGLSHSDLIDNTWDKSYLQMLIDDYLTNTFDEVNDTAIDHYDFDVESRSLTIYLIIELSDGTTLTMSSNLGDDDDATN